MASKEDQRGPKTQQADPRLQKSAPETQQSASVEQESAPGAQQGAPVEQKIAPKTQQRPPVAQNAPKERDLDPRRDPRLHVPHGGFEPEQSARAAAGSEAKQSAPVPEGPKGPEAKRSAPPQMGPKERRSAAATRGPEVKWRAPAPRQHTLRVSGLSEETLQWVRLAIGLGMRERGAADDAPPASFGAMLFAAHFLDDRDARWLAGQLTREAIEACDVRFETAQVRPPELLESAPVDVLSQITIALRCLSRNSTMPSGLPRRSARRRVG